MSLVRLSVAVVTRSQFENISETAAQRDALPKVISSKAVSFRCKINAGQNEDIKSVENQVLSIYENIARVKASSLGVFDSSFSYLQPTESVRFSAEPNNNLYLIVDKVTRQPTERKRADAASVTNASIANQPVPKSPTNASSSSAVANPAPVPSNGASASASTASNSDVPASKRRKATTTANNSTGSPAAQSTPSKPGSGMNRAARRDAQFRGDLPDLTAATADLNNGDPKGAPEVVDETVFDDRSVIKPSPVKKSVPRVRMRKPAASNPPATDDMLNSKVEPVTAPSKPVARASKTKSVTAPAPAKNESASEIPRSATETNVETKPARKAPVKRAAKKDSEPDSSAATETEKKKKASPTRKTPARARKTASTAPEEKSSSGTSPTDPSTEARPLTPPNSAPNSAVTKTAAPTAAIATATTAATTPAVAAVPATTEAVNIAPSTSNQVDSSQTMIVDNDDDESGDSEASDSEDEDEKTRRRQRTERARMVSATLRSSSMEPEETKPVSGSLESTVGQPKASPKSDSQSEVAKKTLVKRAPAKPSDPERAVASPVSSELVNEKSDSIPSRLPEEDRVPGIGGFESLSKIQPNVHDSKAPIQKKPAPKPRYESSDEESEDSEDSEDDDSASESDTEEITQKAPRKKTLKHLYG